ncbi:MAG: hypothetical protein AAGF24_03530 [Cyanobacteria bacterium P01_H01_bin.121]
MQPSTLNQKPNTSKSGYGDRKNVNDIKPGSLSVLQSDELHQLLDTFGAVPIDGAKLDNPPRIYEGAGLRLERDAQNLRVLVSQAEDRLTQTGWGVVYDQANYVLETWWVPLHETRRWPIILADLVAMHTPKLQAAEPATDSPTQAEPLDQLTLAPALPFCVAGHQFVSVPHVVGGTYISADGVRASSLTLQLTDGSRQTICGKAAATLWAEICRKSQLVIA